MNRRTFLLHGAAGAALLARWRAQGQSAPTVRVLQTRVISHQPQHYHGWPTLARRRNGQLIAVWSGGREEHVCPFGRVEMMTSDDDGQTWTWPRVLLDGPIDDRDAGVLETRSGSLLVTTFTSLAYENMLAAAEKKKPGDPGAWPAERLLKWRAAHQRLSAEQRQRELGQWMIRSTDGGVTWSARYPSLVNSPHGPIQLSDGRLLYAGKELWTGERRVGVAESFDDGRTWRWLAAIPTRPDDTTENYHELHAVEAAGGRLIVHIRNHNKANNREILQSESTDGGQTWSVPQAIGVWGLPSHLLRLRNGHLLMTYSHRRAPLGNQARLSRDNGRTWSEPMVISSDGTSGDLGYPSTVELDDGSLLTVWYELMKGSPRAVLRQARWVMEI
jgi:Neuraminidase (sialidase)